MNPIEEKVIALTAEILRIDPGKVHRNAKLVADLGGDSLDIVDLMMAFEKAFEISISDDAVARIVTVGDAIAFIESTQRSRAGRS
jgi:acyl carrier protein